MEDNERRDPTHSIIKLLNERYQCLSEAIERSKEGLETVVDGTPITPGEIRYLKGAANAIRSALVDILLVCEQHGYEIEFPSTGFP